jgi:glycosyltransferase involved in cell wall biosynthesis
MAKVSIITPLLAEAQIQMDWLGITVRSVLAQTEKDWEMIIIVDQSKVGLEPMRDFVTSDPRIRAMRNKGMPGVSDTRNTGVHACVSDLLLPLDADDVLLPNAVERYLWAWANGGSAQGIVYTDIQMFGQNHQRYYAAPSYDFKRLLANTFMSVGCLHRKSDWAKIGGWRSDMQGGLEDWEYWIRMGAAGVCGFLLSEPLYHYRRHGEGRLASLKTDQQRWQTQYQLVRKLHQELYDGRFPKMCCGSAAQSSKPRTPQVRESGPVTNGVRLVYIGPRGAGFGMRGPSGQRYRIPGKGGEFRARQADVQFFLSYAQGQGFRQA